MGNGGEVVSGFPAAASGLADFPIFPKSRSAPPAKSQKSALESKRTTGSNPRPSAWEADALPTELRPRGPHCRADRRVLDWALNGHTRFSSKAKRPG